MAIQDDQHIPDDGVLDNYVLYFKNKRDAAGKKTGHAEILLYIPNGSIGGTLTTDIELFKTTLASLIAGTPGATIITQSPSSPGGDGGLVDSGVNAQKQPAHTTPVKGKK